MTQVSVLVKFCNPVRVRGNWQLKQRVGQKSRVRLRLCEIQERERERERERGGGGGSKKKGESAQCRQNRQVYGEFIHENLLITSNVTTNTSLAGLGCLAADNKIALPYRKLEREKGIVRQERNVDHEWKENETALE